MRQQCFEICANIFEYVCSTNFCEDPHIWVLKFFLPKQKSFSNFIFHKLFEVPFYILYTLLSPSLYIAATRYHCHILQCDTDLCVYCLPFLLGRRLHVDSSALKIATKKKWSRFCKPTSKIFSSFLHMVSWGTWK